MQTERSAQASQRRDLLNLALTDLRLPSFEDVAAGLRHYICNGEDVLNMVYQYEHRDYPKLDNVVRVLAPLIRQVLLRKKGSYIEDDPRCVLFVEGSLDYPDVESVQIAIEKDASNRRDQLEQCFKRHGLVPNRKTASDGAQHNYMNKAFVDDYINGYAYHIDQAACIFLKKGVGQPGLIAYAAACEARRQDLVSALHDQSIKCPYGLQQDLIFGTRQTKTEKDFQDYNRERLGKPKHTQYCISYIYGEGDMLRATDVAAKMKNEQESRQTLVNNRAAEFSLDLNELQRTYSHQTLLNQIRRFVEDGVGEGERLVATVAFEKELRKLALPERHSLFRTSREVEERFNAVATGSSHLVLELVHDLAQQNRNRRDEVAGMYIKAQQAEYGIERYTASEKESDLIEQSAFVRCGTGSANATVHSIQQSVRRERLQLAMKNVEPALSSSNLSTRVKDDDRLLQFIQGRSVYKSEHELASKLREEELSRRREIEELLSAANIDAALDSGGNLVVRMHDYEISRYIAEGIGSAEELVSCKAKEHRKAELKELVEASEMEVSFYNLEKLVTCQDYIQGTSESTPEKLVSSLVEGWKIRKKNINAKLEAFGMNENTLRRGETMDYHLSQAVDDYIELGSGELVWISDAITHHARLHKAAKSLGCLQGLLPRCSYDKAIDSASELEQELAGLTREIVEARCFGGEASQDSGAGTTADKEAPAFDIADCLATQIFAFCRPRYNDAFQYCVSQLSDAHHDHRLVLLLACPQSCPWRTADEAAAALRRERRSRIEQFDNRCPHIGRSANNECFWISDLATQPSPQDKEDRIWEESGARADYVNGKTSLQEAIETAKRREREGTLRESLASASLHSSLLAKNQDCSDFVNGNGTSDDSGPTLKRLIKKLEEDRAQRVQLLNECFLNASLVDTCVATHNYLDLCDSDQDSDDECYYKYPYHYEDADDEYFPSGDIVCLKRSKYIELGKGRPADVVDAFVMFKRVEKLERAIEKRFTYDDLRCHPSDWMRRSRKCKEFVANIKAGVPSQKEIEEHLAILEKKLQMAQERSNNAGGEDSACEERNDSGSDDERSSYGGYDGYDDECGGGSDWKYHLSGGDYGNDPDTDAMWDAYWDS